MTADAVINKIVITDEARFDYESLFGLPIPRADMKGECEKYIDNISGQNIGYYIRAKYYDETIDEMLMLFFYKGKDISKMQMWELAGICRADDWSEEMEEDGIIRHWLKSSFTPREETDWVWDLRVREEQRQKEVEEWLSD